MPYKDPLVRKIKAKMYGARWYQKHIVERKIQIKERRKDIKEYILSRKDKCNRCPETHTSCLEFHHIDGDEKDCILSKVPAQGWSIERVKQEIDKCELLCSNCHRKEHDRLREL